MTVVCKDANEFYMFCNKYLKGVDYIAFDFETNAEETHGQSHKAVGFSIAPNKDIGCYVPIESVDYKMKPDDVEEIKAMLSEILTTKNIMVYNCLHELPVTLNWLGIEIPLERLDDLFVLVKMMMGNANRYQGHGGLKEQASTLLGVDDWSKDLDSYFDMLRKFYLFKTEMRTLLSKYYGANEIESVMDKIERLVNNSNSLGVSYGDVPCNLISKYGAEDSCILFALKDYYFTQISMQNEALGIDLMIGYRVWMKHHYCGYILEKNGAFWNDKKASQIEDWCNATMLSCLKNLICSNLSSEYLKSAVYPQYLDYLKEHYIIKIFGDKFIPKKKTKNYIEVSAVGYDAELELINAGAKALISKKGTKTYKIENCHLEKLAYEFNKENPDMFNNWYAEYMKDALSKYSTIDELKKFINPNATGEDFRRFVSGVVITDEVREARFYLELLSIVRDPLYDNDYYKDFYDEGGGKLNSLKYKLYPFPPMEQFKEEYPNMRYYETFDSKLLDAIHRIDNLNFSEGRKFNFFKKLSIEGSAKDKKILSAIETSSCTMLETLDSDSLNKIYDAYVTIGMDIEDSTTWNERFAWLVNFKMFKKMEKLVSTYINGKVGRKSVYFVNKNSYSNGDCLTKRLIPYNDCKELVNDPMYSTMVQTNFGVNLADTGRWTSGWHNIPAGECIKSIYTSRFKGGCIAMPDGSQMEIRALAAESQDENLFKAFNDGLDIHRYFASKIYKIPYDEVTSRQRSTAKGAVFGLIYGMTERSFAQSYTNGNLSDAKEIYNAMYESFPKIKTYIDNAHKQARELNKVTTITQRYICLDHIRNKAEKDRCSQNYRIQGFASDLAGLIMYYIADYIKTHNMKSKLIMTVHDSIEIDFHPDETFELADVCIKAFNEFPYKEYGTPVACDVPLSANMGAECKIIDNIIEHDDGYNDVTITLSGYIKDIDELVSIWKNDAYDIVEYIDLDKYVADDKDEYQPLGAMMSSGKSVITQYAGTTLKKGQRKIHIIRHK